MGDEGFHLLKVGIAERLNTTGFPGVRLDQVGIELGLTNNLAKTVANLRAILISVAIGRLRRQLLRLA
jgi:hypothetical protein